MRASFRGFTLIELMVAVMIALIVTTASLAVMLAAIATQREGALRGSMTRTTQHAVDTLGADLAFLGAGVPRGYERNDLGELLLAPPAGAAKQLRPPVRIARHDYLAFLGDLPFPNADLNGLATAGTLLSTLVVPVELMDDRISVTSELSPCTPPSSTSSDDCRSSEASLLPIGGPDCDGDTLDAATCPWGLGKWQRLGEQSIPLVIGASDGTWLRRSWDMQTTASARGRLFIDLDDFNLHIGSQNLRAALLSGARQGGTFLSHVDRVFYSLEDDAGGAATCDDDGCSCGDEGCVLLRRHCWGWDLGATDPDAPGFPGVGAAAIRSDASPDDCASPDFGTPWEEVARGISLFQLRYYAADGSRLDPGTTGALSPAAAARSRHVELVMEVVRKQKRGQRLVHRVSRRFYLEHAGGLTSKPETPLADGGCDADGPANECFPQ